MSIFSGERLTQLIIKVCIRIQDSSLLCVRFLNYHNRYIMIILTDKCKNIPSVIKINISRKILKTNPKLKNYIYFNKKQVDEDSLLKIY